MRHRTTTAEPPPPGAARREAPSRHVAPSDTPQPPADSAPLELRVDQTAEAGDVMPALARLLRRMRDGEAASG